jgi:hypothetical protein
METFFKVILIIVLVYYALKFLGRFVFPVVLAFLMKKLMNRIMKGQGGAFGSFYQQTAPQEESFSKTEPKTKKRFAKESGEYIDFEEVK